MASAEESREVGRVVTVPCVCVYVLHTHSNTCHIDSTVLTAVFEA